MLRWIKTREYERCMLFRDGEFAGMLRPGRRLIFDPLWKVEVQRYSVRDLELRSPHLDVIVRSGALEGQARVLELRDWERALVWKNGRFATILAGGQHALWTGFNEVVVEIVDARDARFEHSQLASILESDAGREALQDVQVGSNEVALAIVDGSCRETLKPGRYAFWKGVSRVQILPVDLREQMLEVAGQEIMTADKVTLRVNAVVVYRVRDPLRAFGTSGDWGQTLYRESQLGLRELVGGRELEAFLADKEAVAMTLQQTVGPRAEELGLSVERIGIRDVILPGEMKAILNRVTEARKAAEAQLITRREETAAMRSQANTAKLFEANPSLMRLRELEVLEKVAEKSNLQVVLGEKGLADRISKLI